MLVCFFLLWKFSETDDKIYYQNKTIHCTLLKNIIVLLINFHRLSSITALIILFRLLFFNRYHPKELKPLRRKGLRGVKE